MKDQTSSKIQAATKIQATYKGYLYRRNNLPNSMRYVQKLLVKDNIKCSKQSADGRTNSCLDEDKAIKILDNDTKLKGRVDIPNIRHWFDVAIKDYKYGWLPINIKSTTTHTSDNTGNFAMCVYALTDAEMEIKLPCKKKASYYRNRKMSKTLIKCLKKGKLNKVKKRDYYFVVINKTNEKEIIINSLKGLSKLTPNINNLPFQVKWSNNKQFIYQNIFSIKSKLVDAIIKPKPSWREEFLNEIRKLQ